MKRIVVLGVGALGSHLVMFIRNLGHEVVLVDDDKVESKNVMSQFHTRNGVRQNKVRSLAMLMAFFHKGGRYVQRPVRFVEGNASELLQGAGGPIQVRVGSGLVQKLEVVGQGHEPVAHDLQEFFVCRGHRFPSLLWR